MKKVLIPSLILIAILMTITCSKKKISPTSPAATATPNATAIMTAMFVTEWGSVGTGNGQFDFPQGVAVDSSGNVYVVDRGNSRIQKFSNTGTYITQWGSLGISNGQFDYPQGVAVDSSGNVYVAD